MEFWYKSIWEKERGGKLIRPETKPRVKLLQKGGTYYKKPNKKRKYTEYSEGRDRGGGNRK